MRRFLLLGFRQGLLLAVAASLLNANVAQAQNSPVLRLNEIRNVIPVAHGEEVSFTAVDTLHGQVPQDILAISEGRILFDEVSHEFSYLGNENTRSDFIVDFQAIYPDTLISKVVTISPRLPRVPEASILTLSNSYTPSPSSVTYFLASERPGTKVGMNYVPKRVSRIVQVSGGTIIVDHDQPIMSYHENQDIERLEIIADSVIFRTTLHVPQTNVVIRARVTVFEDPPTGEIAGIVTTPVSLDYRAKNANKDDPAEDGAHGIDGGPISFSVDQVVFPTNQDTARFVTSGNIAQDGGLGASGVAGRSLRDLGSPRKHGGYTYKMVYNEWSKRKWSFGWKTKWYREGTRAFSGSGQDAKPGGRPGNAANGSNVESNHDISQYIDASAGKAGEKAPDEVGGSAGTPQYSYHRSKPHNGGESIRYHIAQDGADAPAPNAQIETGMDGTFVHSGNQYAWLHPIQVRTMLLIGKDSYINGNGLFTLSLYDTYIQSIRGYQQTQYWDSLDSRTQRSFQTLASEMSVIRSKVISGESYFGFPKGYAPYLSFSFLLQSYKIDISRALKVLYLTYLLEKSDATIQQQQLATSLLRDQQFSEIENLKSKYESANTRVLALARKFYESQRSRDSLVLELKRVREELLLVAKDNLKDKERKAKLNSILDITAEVSQFVPGLQPVGPAIKAYRQFDRDNLKSDENKTLVKNIFDAIAKPADDYNKAVPKTLESLESAFDAVKNFDASEFFNNKVYREQFETIFSDLDDASEPLITSYNSILDIYQPTKVTSRELDIELQKLINSSSEYKVVAKRLEDAKGAHAQVIEEHQLYRSMLNTSVGEMRTALLNIDEMNLALANTDYFLSQEIRKVAQDLRQRSLEKLERWHFLMAQAYQFRLLKPYTQRLDISNIFDQMLLLLEAGNGEDLSAAEYESLEGIFSASIQEIVSSIIEEYPFTRKQARISFRLSEERLQQLNQNGLVVINPFEEGLIFDGYESVRIIDIGINRAQYEASATAEYAQSKIEVIHQGISKFVTDGTPLVFYNISVDNPNPHRWVIDIDGVGQYVNSESPSGLDQSLLKTMLALGGHDTDLLFFSAPSVNGNLEIRKRDISSDNSALELKELVFDLTYDYDIATNKYARINVQSNVGMPPVYLSKEDKNQRKNGYAGFERFFHQSATDSVTLTALNEYGLYKFSHWSDLAGRALTGVQIDGTSVKVPLGENQQLKVNYVLPETVLEIQPDTIHLTGESGQFDVPIESTGNDSKLSWKVNASPSWITSLHSGVSTDTVAHFSYEQNVTGVDRSGAIVFHNSDDPNNVDTLIVFQKQASRAFFPVDTLEISADTASIDLQITATNATDMWSLDPSSVPFVALAQNIGLGSASVQFSVEENLNTEERIGTLMLSVGSFEDSLVLVQKGTSLSPVNFQLDTLFLSQAGGDTLVDVINPGTPIDWWVAEAELAGIEIDMTAGTGTQKIQVTYAPNLLSASRESKIVLESKMGKDSLVVVQNGKHIRDANFATDTLVVGPEEDIFVLDVRSDTSWAISRSTSFFTVLGDTTGLGDDTIILQVQFNPGTQSRNGVLHLHGAENEDQVLIIQEGRGATVLADAYLDRDTLEIAASSGYDTVTVHNQPVAGYWEISFLEQNGVELLGESSRFGAGEIVLRRISNPDISPRKSRLVVKDSLNSDTLVIMQAPREEILLSVQESLEQTEHFFFPNPTSDRVYLRIGQEAVRKLRIFNLEGQVVLETTLQSVQSPVDVRHLEPGTYILQVFSTTQVFQSRLVIN